ncbi:MAG: hypothetical protein WBA00_18660 [Rhodococcus sp. (in: high G+C Gram-positive bacteria)]
MVMSDTTTRAQARTTSWKGSPFDCAAALFSYDFVAGGGNYDALEALHRGEVSEWTSALGRSGLFTDAEVEELSRVWAQNPVLLLDALLRDADEMTVRRCRLAWASMDRLSPFQMPVAYSG